MLTDIGLFRVGWQSYGGKVVEMPPSWSGHFDDATGISCKPWGRVSGRTGLMMHSPWRVAPGRTWVDYSLAIPKLTPVRFSFGIAMGPDVVAPDKSDGVTFSCHLIATGKEQELMRQHQAKADWVDFDFDLSQHAGQTVTLRLQVEPGPKNNSSFDYSYFGDAKITVGEKKDTLGELVKSLTSSHAYQATEKASLTALSNDPSRGVTPSNLLPHRNRLDQEGATWRFSYEGADARLVFRYAPATGTLEDFTARMDNGREFQPAFGGGATAMLKKGTNSVQVPLRGGRAVDVKREKDALRVLWEYPAAGQNLRIAWVFRMRGKALEVAAQCDSPFISILSLGEPRLVPLRRSFALPYMPGSVHYLPAEHLFVFNHLDWTVSHASRCPQGTAVYRAKTDGTLNPLKESGYIAVSPDIGEVVPNIPHPPSPYLATLGPCIMLDVWGHHKGTYAGDAALLRTFKDHGIDHMVIIQHDWQRYGYDVKLPDHLPANPNYGGDAGMIEFGRAANECGYRWSLHENYIDLYPDAPSYNPAHRVLKADGSPSPAWYNPGTKVQSFGLKCNHALEHARKNSPEAHRRYATTASYLDVHPCVPPWHQLDYDATQPMAAMALGKVRRDSELFQFERDTHGGPLFGEGADHFYWAGLVDGVEAQVRGAEDHTPFLDFDLLKIHPQMVNHGMGYYERWYRRGYDAGWGVDAGSPESLDKYRAQELAYGHAGFIGHALVSHVQHVWREHNLMHPVQRLYGTAKPTESRYEVAGRLVSGSVALAAGDTSRQRVRHDSGLTIWINWRKEPWVVNVDGTKPASGQSRYVLPQWGWLAVGPDTIASTALHGEHIADFVEGPEYVFADARTRFDLPYVFQRTDIEPRLREFQHLGGNRIRVTYEWIVNETLDANYHCFVHGVNPSEFWGDHIVFQGDHGLPRPTSQWKKGETIVDGPHELVVGEKHDYFNLVIGLHRGARLPLKGVQETGHRVLIARLNIQKKEGRIAAITAEKITPATFQSSSPATTHSKRETEEADFKAHMNPAGTFIDFGVVGTDGSLKIQREGDSLVVFPYPRNKSFEVLLNLGSLAPKAVPARLAIRALAAETQADLGPIAFKLEAGRVRFSTGTPGAGRYVVTWK